MRDFVTPQMFGAAADGVKDDTCAVRTAFEVAARENGVVRFPTGIYRVDELDVPAQLSLEAAPTWSYRRDGRAVLIPARADQRYLLNVTNAVATTLMGLSLNGRKMGENLHGLYTDRGSRVEKDETSLRVDSCRCADFTGDGAHFEGIWAFSMRKSMFIGNKGYGCYLEGCDGFIVDCCFSENNVGFGGDTWNSAVNFTSNRVEWNRECGVRLSGGMRYNLTGNYIDRSYGPAIVIEDAQNYHKRLHKYHTVVPYAITVTGNTIVRSGKAAVPDSDDDCHIRLRHAAGVTITGNTFNIWKDDGRNGRISPNFGIIMDGCADCVITANTFIPGAVKELIHDKGGHGGGMVIERNAGHALPESAWNVQDPFTPVHFLMEGSVEWYRDILKGESNEEPER